MQEVSLAVYVRVCVCVYIYICIYIYIYIFLCMYIYIYVCVCIYIIPTYPSCIPMLHWSASHRAGVPCMASARHLSGHVCEIGTSGHGCRIAEEERMRGSVRI